MNNNYQKYLRKCTIGANIGFVTGSVTGGMTGMIISGGTGFIPGAITGFVAGSIAGCVQGIINHEKLTLYTRNKNTSSSNDI